MPKNNPLTTCYRTHRNFTLLLILFVAFRALALLAYRPGGQVLDFSDYYFYREFAQLSRQGYVPYANLWTTYPPLFPLLMINVWKVSALLPPWEYSNLWFTLLLGGVFLLFEAGNFILLYAIARKLHSPEGALRAAWIYAGLFTPVYTLTGWFESYPLFFFLLALYLLLKGRPYLSAFFGGVGFMIKLIPVLLLPVGVRTLPLPPARRRLRIERLNIEVDVGRASLYLLIFAATVFAIGYPFYRMNPALILSPLSLTGARPPWETVWALLEGNYTYGIIPLDMRNLNLAEAGRAPSTLPWGWITAAFGLLYVFLYTRRVDWRTPRAMVAFSGLTMCFFFLYSKGYSPQWLGWLLVFVAVLLPNLRGVIYAVLLSIANVVEANVYFPIFPDEHWLLAGTVLLRTLLIAALAAEFGLLLWPHLATAAVVRWRRRALAALLAALLVGLLPAGLRLRTAYFEARLAQSPYRAVITWLREQPVTEAILLNDHTAYDWFYPYLRRTHRFYMLDDYSDPAHPVAANTIRLLDAIAARHRAVWIFDADPSHTSPAEAALFDWLGDRPPAHQADIDGGRLYLFLLSPAE